MKFKYCPQCGEKLKDKEIGDEGLLPYCNNCQRPYFEWFGQCVIVAVVNEYNEVLLLKQNYISEIYWILVAGYIKKGDTAELTAEKEVFEESGQRCDELKYIKSYFYEEHDLLMLGYLMRVKKSELVKSVEVDELEWFGITDAISILKDGIIAHEHLVNCKKYI